MGKDRALLGAYLPKGDEEGVHEVVHRLLRQPFSLHGEDSPSRRGPFLEEDARAGLLLSEEKSRPRGIHLRGREGIPA